MKNSVRFLKYNGKFRPIFWYVLSQANDDVLKEILMSHSSFEQLIEEIGLARQAEIRW
jgi:predicted transcriptional regulator